MRSERGGGRLTGGGIKEDVMVRVAAACGDGVGVTTSRSKHGEARGGCRRTENTLLTAGHDMRQYLLAPAAVKGNVPTGCWKYSTLMKIYRKLFVVAAIYIPLPLPLPRPLPLPHTLH